MNAYYKYLLLSSPALAWLFYEAYTQTKQQPNHLTNIKALKKEESEFRSNLIKNIRYEIFLDLTKQQSIFNKQFKGSVKITFELSKLEEIFIDYFGTLEQVKINSNVNTKDEHIENRLIINSGFLKLGLNEIEINFISNYSDYGDKILGLTFSNNVLVTNCEPFYAHRIFPCFDQPNLKADIKLSVKTKSDIDIRFSTKGKTISNNAENIINSEEYKTTEFNAARLSTYQFLLTGGYFETISDYLNPTYSTDISLNIHKYIKHDINPINIYLLIRKSIEWFEKTLSIKYPCNKLDLVFLPDYYITANSAQGIFIFDKAFINKHKDQIDSSYFNYMIVTQVFTQGISGILTPKWWEDSFIFEGLNICLTEIFFSDNTVTIY
jgi:aminopeptidase N